MPKLSSTLEQLARHILKRSQQNRTGFEDGPFDSFAEDEIHASSLPDTELQLALAILEPEFSEAALDAIRQWIKEARPPAGLPISAGNARAMLSAAKWIDLVEPPDQGSTFAIRLACLQRSEGKICSIDAMSITTNPALQVFKDFFQISSKHLNQQIARNTSFCLEWSSFQSEILVKMLEAAKALAQRIPLRATRILLRGASGAGKTFQTLHHPFLYGAVTESGPLCGVQNSDFYKELIQRKYGLSSLQAHREGVALRTVLEDAVNEFAPDMSLVKDVWLHKVSSIDREFTLAAARGGSLQIIDIDVPFLTCCLRIIERIHKQPFSAIPPFEVLLTTFHEIRQSRRYLIEKIRDQKSNCFAYQLLVGCSPMLVAEKKGEKFWVMPGREDAFAEALDTEALNHSGRAYASHLISQSDITQIGPGLRPYLGQPLAATLDRLAKRADL